MSEHEYSSDEEFSGSEDGDRIPCPTPPTNSYWNSKGKYQKQYNRLHKKYVPSVGKANSPQGNILRYVNKVYYRCYNDGDTDIEDHEWLLKEGPLPEDLPEEFGECIGSYEADELERAVDIAIEYCLKQEKIDKKLYPLVDEEHEDRFVGAERREKEMHERIERDEKVIYPIKTVVYNLDLKKAKEFLSAKNIKNNKITKAEIATIVSGLHGPACEGGKNSVQFLPMFNYLVQRKLLTRKEWKEATKWDTPDKLTAMYTKYPILKTLEIKSVLKKLNM